MPEAGVRMFRPEMPCPGCGHRVYLDPMNGWRNDSDGYTCKPANTTHSQHIVPELIIDQYKAELRSQVQALPTRGIGARVVDDELETYGLVERKEVLALIDGGNDDA